MTTEPDNSRLLRLAACERACAGLTDAELANLPAMLAMLEMHAQPEDCMDAALGYMTCAQDALAVLSGKGA